MLLLAMMIKGLHSLIIMTWGCWWCILAWCSEILIDEWWTCYECYTPCIATITVPAQNNQELADSNDLVPQEEEGMSEEGISEFKTYARTVEIIFWLLIFLFLCCICCCCMKLRKYCKKKRAESINFKQLNIKQEDDQVIEDYDDVDNDIGKEQVELTETNVDCHQEQ